MKLRTANRRTLLTSAILGMALTILPVALIEATASASSTHGPAGEILSLLVGPGMTVAAPLFGIHSPAFFIALPLINWSFWTCLAYAGIAGLAKLKRRTGR